MDRIDLTNLGGFPLEQDTLKFLQDSFTRPLQALANLAGDKTILYGVEESGGNVTPGWISYQGELILFQGGVAGADVVISETATQVTFEDEAVHDAYFVKVANCGVGGAFPFADLIRLSSLANMWLPGDIKEKYCDNTYIADNFDVDGYGINREKGWRILSKAYPDAAGKVMVNMDSADGDFNACGKTGGVKEVTLSLGQMPSHRHKIYGDNTGGSGGVPYALNQAGVAIAGAQRSGGLLTTNGSGINLMEAQGSSQAHNNMQPYFVVLKLIKL